MIIASHAFALYSVIADLAALYKAVIARRAD